MRTYIALFLFLIGSLNSIGQGLKADLQISDKLEVLSRFRFMVFSETDTINLFYFNETDGHFKIENGFPYGTSFKKYTAVIFFATDLGPWHNEFIYLNISAPTLKFVSLRVKFDKSTDGKDYLAEFSADYIHDTPLIELKHSSDQIVGQRPEFEIYNSSKENLWVYPNMPARFFIEEDYGYKMRIIGKNVPTLSEDIPINQEYKMTTEFILASHEKPYRYRFPLHNEYTIYLTNQKDQHIIPKSYKDEGKTWKVSRKIYEVQLEYDVVEK